MDQRSKMDEVVPKMARRKSSVAGQSRKRVRGQKNAVTVAAKTGQ